MNNNNDHNVTEPNSGSDDNPTILSDTIMHDDRNTSPATSTNPKASTKHGMLLEIQCLLSVPCYEALGKKDMKKNDIINGMYEHLFSNS